MTDPKTGAVAIQSARGRISERTPKDLRGVDVLAERLGRQFETGVRTIDGRQGPFDDTPWQEDLPASRELLGAAGEGIAEAIRAGAIPISLATDCSLAIGTFPAVGASLPTASFLWLDAHADYDVPETSAGGFLGCMSLAGACGAWDTGMGAIDPGRVVHVGARAKQGEFDFPGQEQGRAELGAMLGVDVDPAAVIAALPEGPVYVHLDPDVLDPAFNPIWYGRPDGMTADALVALLRELRARRSIVGIEVTAFHSDDDESVRERVSALLGEAVGAVIEV